MSGDGFFTASEGFVVMEDTSSVHVGRPPDAPLQVADVGRLVRRGVRGLVGAARAGEQPTLSALLAEHLGPGADELPVVDGHLAVVRARQRADRAGRLARRARPDLRAGRRRRLPAPPVRPGRDARHRRAARRVRAAPRQRRAGRRRRRPGRRRCGPCVQCGSTWCRGRRLRVGAAGPRGRPEQRPADGDRAVRRQRARRPPAPSRRRAREPGRRAQRLPRPGAVVRQRGVRARADAAAVPPAGRRSTADALVLPAETLAAVHRQVVEVARHKQQLLAAGQHLKRGLLLYGPPGVGKTHTVRYLISSLAGTTVLQLSAATPCTWSRRPARWPARCSRRWSSSRTST